MAAGRPTTAPPAEVVGRQGAGCSPEGAGSSVQGAASVPAHLAADAADDGLDADSSQWWVGTPHFRVQAPHPGGLASGW